MYHPSKNGLALLHELDAIEYRPFSSLVNRWSMVELENQRLAERLYEKVYKSEVNPFTVSVRHEWKLVIHCRLTSRGAFLAKETRKEDP